MNMHVDHAKAEIAARLHHAEQSRSAKHARTLQRSGATPRWQRFRSA